MAHKKIIDSVKKQGQVTIKDLDEFLRFVIYEYDMRTFDANYISILIPMQFDIDKVFGLNVCKRSDGWQLLRNRRWQAAYVDPACFLREPIPVQRKSSTMHASF